MRALFRITFAMVAGFLFVANPAVAVEITVTRPNSIDYSMVIGRLTTQPIGHFEFCKKHRAKCREVRYHDPLMLTPDIWKQLLGVNQAVNESIQPLSDIDAHGKDEVWSYVDKFGDCEDYALEKRRQLIALGIPASNLLLTVVRQDNGLGHAILTVRAQNSQGLVDLVLDNLDARILRWQNTPYHFIKRQSPRHAGKWESINDSRDIHTAAAN